MKVDIGSSQDEVRIEIVPLIDVIFCILIFFILAAVNLTRQQAIEVDLPRSTTGEAQMRDLALVTLGPKGELYFERQRVDREQLANALQTFHQAKPTGTMVLYASQSAYYSEVVALLDLMRSIGGNRVSLATLPTEPITNGSNGSSDVVPGSSLPSNALPGSAIPGSAIPGGAIPGGTLPGGTIPGGAMPGQTIPGQTIPGQTVPGVDRPWESPAPGLRPGSTTPLNGSGVPSSGQPSQSLPGQSNQPLVPVQPRGQGRQPGSESRPGQPSP